MSYAVDRSWHFVYVSPVVVLALIALTVVNAERTHSDLFTKVRRSVSYRRFLPEKTVMYKLVTAASMFCLIGFTLSHTLVLVFHYLNVFGGLCQFSGIQVFLQIFSTTLAVVAKCLMYQIFLMRLFLIYGGSVFAYSPRALKFWAVVFAAVSVVLVVTGVLFTLEGGSECNTTAETVDSRASSPAFYILTILFLFQEVCGSIGFLVAFLVPLRKTLKLLEINHSKNKESSTAALTDKKSRGKFHYVAVKITTLTGVATISTVLGVFGSFAGFDAVWPLDALINCICVALMTLYYQDAIYYTHLCCCCIKCCTPRSEAYQSQVRKELSAVEVDSVKTDTGQTLTESVDTADQPKVAANAVALTDMDLNNVSLNRIPNDSNTNRAGSLNDNL